MKALILAGGFGTRLRPLTYTRPKHLLPIANKPHIEHVFDLLQRHDVNDAVLLTSYLADAFARTLERAAERGLRLEVTHEAEPLGTAGALKNAEGLLDGGTFFAFNGDVLCDFNLTAVLEFHGAREADATIVLTPVEDPSAFGVVPTEADGRVVGFIEKPPREQAPTNRINAGIYVLEPSVLERIPAGQPYSAERALFPELVADGARVYAVDGHGYWMDIGTPEKYLQANLDALHGRYRTNGSLARDHVALAPGACCADGARVSWSCLGSDSLVNEDAVVERCVLLDGAVVGARARVVGSILGERARVEPGAEVIDRTVADGELVGS